MDKNRPDHARVTISATVYQTFAMRPQDPRTAFRRPATDKALHHNQAGPASITAAATEP